MSPPRATAAARLGTLLLVAPALAVIAAVFLLPIARLFALSFSAKAGPLAAYHEVLVDPIYHYVFVNTFVVAGVVTVAALVIGYPIAFALTRISAGWRSLLFACVLFPLWISVLVRTFSWMLLLERNGPVNRLLVGSGLADQPLSLVFNRTGVLIGMVHVLLPYAVLPIYAALVRIDPALLRASEGLGASRARTFLAVLLPLSMRGVATAATFVFLLSLGFFITPALLGGPSSMTLSMLIDGFVNERLDWPLAAAASMVLLVFALVFVAVAGRFVSLGGLAEAHR